MTRTADVNAVVERLKPDQVSAYLGRTGVWRMVHLRLEDGLPAVEVWEHLPRPIVPIHLPLTDRFADYHFRLKETLRILADAEDRWPMAIAADLLAEPTGDDDRMPFELRRRTPEEAAQYLSEQLALKLCGLAELRRERDEQQRRAEAAETERDIFKRKMIVNRDRAEAAGRRELAAYRAERRAQDECARWRQQLTEKADAYHRLANSSEGTPEMRAGAGVAAAEIRVVLAALDGAGPKLEGPHR